MRLRPILMTSIATIAGAVPLVAAGGPGSASRSAIGVVVIFGVAFSTLLSLYVVPSFYALLAPYTRLARGAVAARSSASSRRRPRPPAAPDRGAAGRARCQAETVARNLLIIKGKYLPSGRPPEAPAGRIGRASRALAEPCCGLPPGDHWSGALATATPYQQLEQEFRRLHAFRGVLAILRWDAAVTMPRASADVRGDQLAALEIETHTLLVSPRISRLLDRADANAQSLAGWQAANLREMRRLHDHAIATPQSLIARMAKAFARAESRWREAREANDFNVLAPQLEETVKLVRSKAELLGQRFSLEPWDALADEFTPGLLSRDIEAIFTPLAQRLPALVTEAIELQAAAPALPIEGRFSASRQRGLCTDVMKALGFPFDRGRFDESDHAFTEGVPGDIRVTDAVRAEGPVPGTARRAARDRPGALRPRPAVGMGRPAGRPGPRHGDRGEPVAAARDDGGPEPRLRDLPAAAAREALRRGGPRVDRGEPLSAT